MITKKYVFKKLKEQQDWRNSCLNMIASESILSPNVLKSHTNDFLKRYAEGGIEKKKYYNGTKIFDRLEIISRDLLKKLFKVKYVDNRPLSGSQSNLIVLSALTNFGDNIYVNNIQKCGHISVNAPGIPSVLNLNHYSFPTKDDGFNIDVDELKKQLNKIIKTPFGRKINNMVVGKSLFLFEEPLKELSNLCKEYNINLIYDMAHPAGLVAGKQFQKDIFKYSDIVTSSTHKTFMGPQHGMILSDNLNDDKWKLISKKVFPSLTSNSHLFTIPPLIIATLEHLKYGEKYAKDVISNSKFLAKELDKQGFDVCGKKLGYTQTHQIAINVKNLDGGNICAKKLEKNNIITNKNLLPHDKINIKTLQNPSGLRISSHILTRLGMKKEEMKYIAYLFNEILIKNKNKLEEVKKLKRKFNTVKYCDYE